MRSGVRVTKSSQTWICKHSPHQTTRSISASVCESTCQGSKRRFRDAAGVGCTCARREDVLLTTNPLNSGRRCQSCTNQWPLLASNPCDTCSHEVEFPIRRANHLDPLRDGSEKTKSDPAGAAKHVIIATKDQQLDVSRRERLKERPRIFRARHVAGERVAREGEAVESNER